MIWGSRGFTDLPDVITKLAFPLAMKLVLNTYINETTLITYVLCRRTVAAKLRLLVSFK